MKKIIIPVSALFVVGLSHAQSTNLSTNENYVYTKTYLDYTGTTPSKTAETVQYIDGLGRPKQIVNIKASPTQKDVVTHIEYDGFGRQVKDYLPVPQSGTMNGAIVPNPLANATQPEIYGAEKIYAEKILENSPLDRIQQQVQVGTDWNNKPVKFEYDANTAGEVKKYTATFNYSTFQSQITLSATDYGANQLYKNTVTDEDGNKTVEFKNGQGQTILLRKMLDGTASADTYYVYNDYNQLAYVIPPLAVAANAVDETTLNNLCYRYKYDARNRPVEKKVPGKGWEYMLYDKQDRLVATRDANLEAKGQWLFTKYDQFGRVAFTGISTGGARTAEQAEVELNGGNSMLRSESVGFSHEGMDVYYTGRAYPADNKYLQLLSISYYDTYAPYSFNPSFPATVFGISVITDNSTGNTVSTKSLPVMSLVKNIEDNSWTKNYTWYDERGRALASHSINHLGGYTKTESQLDFSGTPKQVVTRHKRLATDTERVITENFTYDHQNRLLVHTHQVDNNPVEYLAQNEYNPLSQLKTKKVGGISSSTPLQTVDYQYNIRGWMTKINDPVNLNGKLFGYEMRYTNPVNPGNATARFNGNIAEIDWNNASENLLKRYNYQYDNLNRLNNAFYKEPTTGNSNYFDEYLSYDLNGNIASLKRTAMPPVAGTTGVMVDNLDYVYSGNRLTQVIENQSNDTGYEGGNNTIDYDLNGSMMNMKDKGIQSIGYNHLSLPDYFSIYQNNIFGTPVNFGLNYLYRADGVKVRKTYSTGGGRGQSTSYKYTDYLDGFQYSYSETVAPCPWCRTSVAYEEQAFKEAAVKPGPIAIAWTLDFVPTSEGFFSFTENRYIYQYRDHLGNARVSYAKNSQGAIEVTDVNNYYAFGLNHIGANKAVLGGYQNYKYNGKELQETGMYDYGARFYMPDIGRWGVVDPLAEMYRRHTPYAYAVNNPIYFIDPDGMQIDPANQKEWNRLKGSVTNTRDALQSDVDKINQKAKDKGWDSKTLASKMGDKQDRLNSVNQSLTNMSILESSDQMYGLNKMEGTDGITSYDSKTDKINIGYVSEGNFVHEMTHGAQFESGDIAFDVASGNSLAQDLDDEAAAYRAQAAFDPSSFGGISVNKINNNFLTTLSDQNGNKVYGVGGTAKSGLFGVTINSNVGQLRLAYPQAKEALKNLDQSIKLRDFQGVKFKGK